jgi:hypothetical protein
MSRDHRIEIKLTDDELAQLDELRPPGMPRAVYLRSLIHKPPEVADVASREESLALLTAMSRDGKVTAAIALARELRDEDAPADDEFEAIFRDE